MAQQNRFHSRDLGVSFIAPEIAKGQKLAARQSVLKNSDIDAALRGDFVRSALTGKQSAVLLAVTVLVCTIPILYTLLLVALALFTLDIVFFHLPSISPLPALAYLLSVAFLAMLFVFLLRPFLPLHRGEAAQSRVSRRSEPTLHHFVSTICRRIGVAPPKTISVSMEIDISASPEGWRGWFNGDWHLTIGLPLIACLGARELGGALSHELGRLENPVAGRAFFLLRSVRDWLSRCCDNRDGWSASLVAARDESSGMVRRQLLTLGLHGLQLTNHLFRGLRGLLDRIAMSSAQALEFDADRFQIHMAGSESFASAVRALSAMFAVFSRELENCREQKRKAVDNFAELIRRHLHEVSNEELESAAGALRRHYVNWSMLPADDERVRRAQEQNQSGILTLDQPSADLICDLPSLAKSLSLKLYQSLGLGVVQEDLQSLSPTQEKTAQKSVRGELLNDFCGREFLGFGVWKIPDFQEVKALSVREKLDKWNASLVEIRQLLPSFFQCRSAHQSWLASAIEKNTMEFLVANNYPVAMSEGDERVLVNKVRSARDKFLPVLRKYQTHYGWRVTLALALADNEDTAKRGLTLLAVLKKLAELEEQVQEFHLLLGVTRNIASACYERGEERFLPLMTKLGRQMREAIAPLEKTLVNLPKSLLVDESLPQDVLANRLGTINEAEERQRAHEVRLLELITYFDCFNRNASAQLAKLVTPLETLHGIESLRRIKSEF